MAHGWRAGTISGIARARTCDLFLAYSNPTSQSSHGILTFSNPLLSEPMARQCVEQY